MDERQEITNQFLRHCKDTLDINKKKYSLIATYKAPEIWFQFEMTAVMHENLCEKWAEWDLYTEKSHKDMFILPKGIKPDCDGFKKGVNIEFKVAPSGDSMEKFYDDIEKLKGFEYGYFVVVYCNVNKDYPPYKQAGLKPDLNVFKSWEVFKNDMKSTTANMVFEHIFEPIDIERKDYLGDNLKAGLAIGAWKS